MRVSVAALAKWLSDSSEARPNWVLSVARVDGFAWMFAMLVFGIGLLVVIYARYYMSPTDPMARFYSPFMGATLKAPIDANYADAAHSFEQFAIKADSSFVVNARVAIADITTRDGGPLLEVALWSRNLLNETYVYRRDPSNRNTLGDYGNFNNPRTFGIELRASY